MKARTLLLTLFLLGMMSLPADSYAAVGDITVEIGGDPACTKGPLPPPLDIGGPCPPTGSPIITISAISTSNGNGKPRVELTPGTTDSTVDSLRLVNTRITANSAIPTENFHIKFYREHIKKPDVAAYYKATAYGSFGPTDDPRVQGNSLSVWGYANKVPDPLTAVGSPSPYQYVVDCDPGGCYNNFNLVPTGTSKTFGTDNRVLTADFSIKLQTAGDTLNLSGAGVKVASSSVPDLPCPAGCVGGGDTPCVVCPSLWWLITVIGLLVLILLVLLWCCRARKLPA